jgi:hypothetical protein
MPISQINTNSIATGAVSAADLAAGAARANFGAGAVLQVAQAVLTTTFFTNSNGTFVDVTNLAVTITPASSSSKFLLLGSVVYGAEFNANPCLRFSGGNATNYVGDARGSRRRVAWSGGDDYFNGTSSTVANQITFTAQMTYLDSPATSSAITYKIQAMSDENGGMYINRDVDDPDSSGEGYTAASSLLVLEIAG